MIILIIIINSIGYSYLSNDFNYSNLSPNSFSTLSTEEETKLNLVKQIGKLALKHDKSQFKHFYYYVNKKSIHLTIFELQTAIKLERFIIRFHEIMVNMFDLNKTPPIEKNKPYQTRIEELNSTFADNLHNIDNFINQLLKETYQNKTTQDKLFPDSGNFNLLSRGIECLNEIAKHLNEQISPSTYQKLFTHIQKIVRPPISETLSKEIKKTLILANQTYHHLKQITISQEKSNKQIEGFIKKLTKKVTHLNIQLINKQIKKGDYAHLNQRIEAINQMAISQNISAKIPIIKKEDTPAYIFLHTLDLLGNLGLRTKEAIKLALSFTNKFENKDIKAKAYSTLSKNKEQIEPFLIKEIVQAQNNSEKLLYMERYDNICQGLNTEDLHKIFPEGSSLQPQFKELAQIISNQPIKLADFFYTPFFKPLELPLNNQETLTESEKEKLKQAYFKNLNTKIQQFKNYTEKIETGSFQLLINKWGIQYVLGWSLSDYKKNQQIFESIIKLLKGNQTNKLPIEEIINHFLEKENPQELIEKLMLTLLDSKISFDFNFFKSLMNIISQKELQIKGGAKVTDVFAEEQMKYQYTQPEPEEIKIKDPVIFAPIIKFLIIALNIKQIIIPLDAFIETDISFFLNTMSQVRKPNLGYKKYLAHKLMSSIPYTKNFNQELLIRDTISKLDESFHQVKKGYNELFRFIRIKTHRDPSYKDYPLADTLLTQLLKLSTYKPLKNQKISTLPPLKIILQEIEKIGGNAHNAITAIESHFDNTPQQFYTFSITLNEIVNYFQTGSDWKVISNSLKDTTEKQKLKTKIKQNNPNITNIDIDRAILLINFHTLLKQRWTLDISDNFFNSIFAAKEQQNWQKANNLQKLNLISSKKQELYASIMKHDPQLTAREEIQLKRHVAEDTWGYAAFGFWPSYKEKKFGNYNKYRKVCLIEQQLIEQEIKNTEKNWQHITPDSNIEQIREMLDSNISLLIKIMEHIEEEGLAPSQTFKNYLNVITKDKNLLTLSMLSDIIYLLQNYTINNIDNFFAFAFGNMPQKIAKAIGRRNLTDQNFKSTKEMNNSSYYEYLQEKLLGDMRGSIVIISQLERFLTQFDQKLEELIFAKQNIKISAKQKNNAANSQITLGLKGYNLLKDRKAGFNVPALQIINTQILSKTPNIFKIEKMKNTLIDYILQLEKETQKTFPFNQEKLKPDQIKKIKSHRKKHNPNYKNSETLTLSARSGSFRSLPGILGTVTNIGFIHPKQMQTRSNIKTDSNFFYYDSYRMFLSTFGSVIFGIDEKDFSEAIDRQKKQYQQETKTAASHFSEMNEQYWQQTIRSFQTIIKTANLKLPLNKRINIDFEDPLAILAQSVIGIWKSWDTKEAKEMRSFMHCSDDWKTPVILQEMKFANLNSKSFSAIIVSGNTNEKDSIPQGDILFNSSGVNIASGLANTGISINELKITYPLLHESILKIINKIKRESGNLEIDVELTGEWNPETDSWNIYLLQRRGIHSSPNIKGDNLIPAYNKKLKVESKGKAVTGGSRHGIIIDGTNITTKALKQKVEKLRKKLDHQKKQEVGIFILLDYVDPSESLKFNIKQIDGVITTKIGTSSHASIIARRLGKLFISEASNIINHEGKWIFKNSPKINIENEIFTIIGLPIEKTPLSGSIFKGALPLIEIQKDTTEQKEIMQMMETINNSIPSIEKTKKTAQAA